MSIVTDRRRVCRGAMLLSAILVLGPAAPATAAPKALRAEGSSGSDVITIHWSERVTGVDATKIVVYPGAVARFPPFSSFPGVSEGCGASTYVTNPNPGTGSPKPGVSFTTTGATASLGVQLVGAMGTGEWAVKIEPGAISPAVADCVHFVVL